MAAVLPKTEKRVLENSPEEINRRLRRQMETRIFYFAVHPDLIDDRLVELDNEWDIERLLEANAAGVSLFGVLMAAKNRTWLLLPMVVAGFLMQHALQGWCPPVPIFRRLGIRTTYEINIERIALKALRGDFGKIKDEESSKRALAALEAATM